MLNVVNRVGWYFGALVITLLSWAETVAAHCASEPRFARPNMAREALTQQQWRRWVECGAAETQSGVGTLSGFAGVLRASSGHRWTMRRFPLRRAVESDPGRAASRCALDRLTPDQARRRVAWLAHGVVDWHRLQTLQDDDSGLEGASVTYPSLAVDRPGHELWRPEDKAMFASKPLFVFGRLLFAPPSVTWLTTCTTQ